MLADAAAAIEDDRGADLPPDGGDRVVIVVTLDGSVQKWRRRSGLDWLAGFRANY